MSRLDLTGTTDHLGYWCLMISCLMRLHLIYQRTSLARKTRSRFLSYWDCAGKRKYVKVINDFLTRTREIVQSPKPNLLCLCLLAPSFVPLFLRSLVRSFVRSFARLSVPSFVCTFVRSLVRSSVRLYVRLLACPFARLFIRSFVRSLASSFLPSLVRPSVNLSDRPFARHCLFVRL